MAVWTDRRRREDGTGVEDEEMGGGWSTMEGSEMRKWMGLEIRYAIWVCRFVAEVSG
jgi:hypothetical protein